MGTMIPELPAIVIDTELIVDEGFRGLYLPLPEGARQSLENQLLQNGCQEAVCLWGRVILEGHDRYEICMRKNLPFPTRQIPVRDRQEAVSWICVAQLKRRDIPEEMRKYLIGKRYIAERQPRGRFLRQSPSANMRSDLGMDTVPPGRPPIRTGTRLAQEYHLSYGSIARYAQYASAIDRLRRYAPVAASAILTGELKTTQAAVLRLSQSSEGELGQIDRDRSSPSDNGFLKKKQKRPARTPPARSVPATAMSIKRMPDYDPDAEILGLTLTIPSWISSITRAHSTADLPETSSQARSQLSRQLRDLRKTADDLLTVLEKLA